MKTIILSLLLLASTSFGQTIASKKNYQPPIDLLDNGGFEAGKAGWTQSGGTFSIVTTGANLLYDKASATFDPTTSGQYIQSKLYTVPKGLYGQNCAAEISYQGGDANLKLVVLDGSSAVLATRTFDSAATTPRPFGVSFPCPTSGTFRVRVESLGDAALAAIDRIKLGEMDTFQVASPKYIGSLKSAATPSCEWTTSAGSLTGFAADSDCPTPSVTGEITAPGTKIPGFVVQGPGDFLVTMSGANFAHSSVADGGYSVRISNGTQHSNTVTGLLVTASTFASITPNNSYTFSISLPAGSHTVQVQAATVNPTLSLSNNGNTDDAGLNFQVYKYPTVSEVAYRPDTINWLVDANISGANPSLGTSAQTSYVEITDSGLTLTQNSGSIGVQIPCSSTNPPTGTTCAAGSESLGVSFNLPAAGAVQACASFTHNVNLNAVSRVETIFQIVETPTNAQTISQEGKTRSQSGFTITSGTGDDRTLSYPHEVCGVFNFASAGQKVLRLMYEQSVGGSPLSSSLLADADGSVGQRDIHWTVKPINQNVPAPVLVGLTSKVDGPASGSVMYSVSYNGVSQTTSNEYENWVSSIVRNSTGNYTVNFDGGIFAQAPNCFATIANTANNTTIGVFGVTTSSATVETYSSGTLANDVFNLMCHAQK